MDENWEPPHKMDTSMWNGIKLLVCHVYPQFTPLEIELSQNPHHFSALWFLTHILRLRITFSGQFLVWVLWVSTTLVQTLGSRGNDSENSENDIVFRASKGYSQRWRFVRLQACLFSSMIWVCVNCQGHGSLECCLIDVNSSSFAQLWLGLLYLLPKATCQCLHTVIQPIKASKPQNLDDVEVS